MISLDTNVVVRIFVDDPDNPEQTRKVREIVRQYKTVYITQVVQVETVWVLIFQSGNNVGIGEIIEQSGFQVRKRKYFCRRIAVVSSF